MCGNSLFFRLAHIRPLVRQPRSRVLLPITNHTELRAVELYFAKLSQNSHSFLGDCFCFEIAIVLLSWLTRVSLECVIKTHTSLYKQWIWSVQRYQRAIIWSVRVRHKSFSCNLRATHVIMSAPWGYNSENGKFSKKKHIKSIWDDFSYEFSAAEFYKSLFKKYGFNCF